MAGFEGKTRRRGRAKVHKEKAIEAEGFLFPAKKVTHRCRMNYDACIRKIQLRREGGQMPRAPSHYDEIREVDIIVTKSTAKFRKPQGPRLLEAIRVHKSISKADLIAETPFASK